MDQLLQDIYDPASPNYHHYLTPEQFVERFGPTAADYEVAIAHAEANHLKVTGRHPNRVVLDVEGPVADIESALHVTMRLYDHPTESRPFYAPDAEPTPDLPVPLLHISGLDDYSLPRPMMRAANAVDQPARAVPRTGRAPGGSYAGGDFRAAYVPGTALTGDGQSVGLLQFDGYHASDIAAYRTQFGLPAVPLINVAVDGGVSSPGNNNAEVCLDIEMVMSMAPGLTAIYVFEAPNPSPWEDLLSIMVTFTAIKQFSCSWGGGSSGPTAEAIFKQMAAQGQSFFNASGDSDAFCTATWAIAFPAESTNITQVGGTTLTTSGPGGSYVSETVWNWGGGVGSSGGISTRYAIPLWQQGLSMVANLGSTTMRNLPDVALTADNVYVTYGQGVSGTFGGTSCAAPLWAGFAALVNQQAMASSRPTIGFINPAVYDIARSGRYAADFHDITTGNNAKSSCGSSMFPAVAGYDLATGLGTPNGLALINDLAPVDVLRITPFTGFSSIGSPGGLFVPPGADYTLSNVGTNSLNWSATSTQPWLTVNPSRASLAPGAGTNVTVVINTNAQSLGYGTYTATLRFSNELTAFSQTRDVQLTIAAPALSISDAAVWEGNSGLTNLLFPVGLMPPSTQTVTVAYSTANGTALAGIDYVSTNGLLSFLAGETNKTVVVPVIGDTNSEPNETFFVNLTSPTNAVLARAQSTGTILDDYQGPFFDNFDPGIHTNQWSAFGGVVGSTILATNYGGYVSSPNSLWFGDAGSRYAVSRAVNTLQGGVVGFWLHIANGASSPWENVDLPGEGIVLEYSTNGSAWVEFGRYDTTDYWAWTHLTVDIPVAAQTANTSFRWRQLSNSGTGYDQWALDDVGVQVGPCPPTITQQPASRSVLIGGTATFNVSAAGSLPLFYLWKANGTFIAGATNATYVTNNVQLADSGTQFSCLVSNAFGNTTSLVAILAVVNPSIPDSFNPLANGTVYCTAVQPDGKILVGGGFTTLRGQSRSRIGRLNADGTLDISFNPGAGGTVYSLAVQPDGTILVAGGFTTLGGQSRSCIGRLNADGTLDASFNPGADNNVYSLLVQPDGRILVGGAFTSLAGQSRSYIGRLNADGSLDATFNPQAGGYVCSIALQSDGKILVGGRFNILAGQTRYYIGRLNSDGSLDAAFNPVASSSVYALALQPDGRILLGGAFTYLGGQSRSCIGRLNADGSLDTTFNPGAGSSVYSLALQVDGRILVGGGFTSLGGQSRSYLGRLNPDGLLDATFNPGAGSSVLSLAIQADGKILAGGNLTTLGGQGRAYLGRLTPTDPATQALSFDGSTVTWQRGGSSPEVWRTAFEGSPDGTNWLALGAGARIPGGWQLSGLSWPTNATLRARGFVTGGYYNGSVWFVETNIGPPAFTSQPVNQTVASGTSATFTVLAAGASPLSYSWLLNGAPIAGATNATYLTNNLPLAASGSQFNCVVSNAYGTTTSLVATLTVLVSPPTITLQPANQLALPGSSTAFGVAAAGSLPLSFQWRSSCGALTEATNSTLTLPGVTTNQSGCAYWVEITNAFGAVTSAVATLTVPSPSTADSFYPGANGSIYGMAVQADGRVVVGGVFTTLAGQGRSCVGRLNPDGTLDSTFNPGAGSNVYSLTLQPDGKILVGGAFTTLAGQSRSCLGRLNTDGALDSSFSPGAGSDVYSLVLQPDGKILVGGAFWSLAGQSRYYIGRLNTDGTLDSSFNPGAGSNVYSLALQPDGKILVAGAFGMLAGKSSTYIGRLNADATLDTNFTAWANGYVYSLALQPDGKIVVGGNFTTLCGLSRSYLGRLNPDGTLDSSFNPAANASVNSLAVQADGKILVGGLFTGLGGQGRGYLGRLNPDGTLDNTFDAGANSSVLSLVVQADGKILVGGNFTTLGGQSRSYMGRLTPTVPATQTLSFDGSTITWLRGGSSPEVWRTVFEISTIRMNWVTLGAGARIPGGWQLSGLDWTTNATLRARGFVTSGYYNGSGSFVETVIGPPFLLTQPVIQSVAVGDTATFSVAAIGDLPLSYSWLLNGLPIDGATNNAFTTNNLPLAASGSQFSCLVSNFWGTMTSRVATLTVVALPPTITQQPANQSVLAGSSATFSLVATGTPPLSCQWWSSCGPLVDATNSVLTLLAITTNLSGCAYWAAVSNPWGSVTSAVAMLTVVNSSAPDNFNPGVNGTIYSMAMQPDGKILVGGFFNTLAGQSRSSLGRLSSDGALDTGFNPGVNGTVYTLALQPDGKLLVGGTFTTVAGLTRSNLCRLNPDGTLDPGFNPGAHGSVYSLLLQPDGSVVVGGNFDKLGGQNRYALGRLNPDGTLDSTFNPAPSGGVCSLALQPDGKIVVAGYFTQVGGQGRYSICRLNADGSLDPNFIPIANSTVYSLAVQPDGKILVGGAFNQLGDQLRPSLGRLNSDGSLDYSFTTVAGNIVYSLALQADGRILLAGLFTTLGGQSCPYLGRLNPDGSLDASFTPRAGSSVYSLAIQSDGKILVGGAFTTLGGQNRAGLGRLTPTDPATQTLNFDGSTVTWQRAGSSPEVSRTVFEGSTNGTFWAPLGAGARIPGGWQLNGLSWPTNALLRARGFVIGGDYDGSGWFVETITGPTIFTTQPLSQSVAAGGSAIFSVVATGGAPLCYSWLLNGLPMAGETNASYTSTNLPLSASGSQFSCVISNGWGSITSQLATLTVLALPPTITQQPVSQSVFVGSNASFTVAATGSIPISCQWWSSCGPLPDATNTTLALLAVTTNLAGCTFSAVVSNAYGSVTSQVAMLTVMCPSTPDTFNPGANGAIFGMAVQADGKILVGGDFTALGGQNRSRIARLNPDGSLDFSFNPGTDGSVDSLALQPDGKILVGGSFTSLAGQNRAGLGRLNADGTLDLSFNPGANGSVYSLVIQADGKILVGGTFATLTGQSRFGLGRINADGTLDSSFNPNATNSIYSLALQADGKILVGGAFTILGGQTRFCLGRLNADGTLDSSFNPGVSNYVASLLVQADGKILVGGYFTTLAGQRRSCLGRLNPDGTLDTSFNPGASSLVTSLALQADGRILVGGYFTVLGGQGRAYLGRLNADGTLDTVFNPGAGYLVFSLALQADGSILAGGAFTTLGGQSRSYLGRLTPTEPATQALTFDGSTVSWQRGGSSPEVWRTTFDASTNGTNWVSLGGGTRIAGGWQLSGLNWPTNALVRARGFTTGGYFTGSGWFVETNFGAPLIMAQPVSQTVPVGSSATFSIGACSSLPLSYLWLCNGLPIPGATNTCFTSTNAQLSDSCSQFSCILSNTCGTVLSSNATLAVLGQIALYPFDSDPGWARQGEWAFGVPKGQGGIANGYPDPATAATGSNVFGVNLDGDYTNIVGGPSYLTAGPFNFSGFSAITLRFQRWLNTDTQPSVYATLDISTNGLVWSPIWSNGAPAITDSNWVQVAHNLAGYADHQPAVYLRWGHEVRSASASPFSGWNLDDVEFLGAPDAGLAPLFVPGTLTQTSDGQFQFTLAGKVGVNYEIQVSSNLADWTPLTVITLTNSAVILLDTTTGLQQRFYRAKPVP